MELGAEEQFALGWRRTARFRSVPTACVWMHLIFPFRGPDLGANHTVAMCSRGSSPTPWTVSSVSTLRLAFCKGQPKIFDTDPGAQFTADAFSDCRPVRDVSRLNVVINKLIDPRSHAKSR